MLLKICDLEEFFVFEASDLDENLLFLDLLLLDRRLCEWVLLVAVDLRERLVLLDLLLLDLYLRIDRPSLSTKIDANY